jgi:hypothetical protein
MFAKKSSPLSLPFVMYLYKILPLGSEEPNCSIFKKVPGACFCLDLIHMIHLSKERNTSCEGFALTAGGSEITPFHLFYLQEVLGACPRMDSVYLIHLSTNWVTSCEGSIRQLASAK